MPLPELNTSGIDVTKTLNTINSMKLQDLQRRNYESEIADRALQGPSKVAERDTQNALRIVQKKREEAQLTEENRKSEAAKLDDVAKAAGWVMSHPEPEKAYEQASRVYANEGLPWPKKDLFMKKQEDGTLAWDNDKFERYTKGNIRARKLELDPKDGEKAHPVIQNPNFDPNQEESSSNPRLIETTLFLKNGQWVSDPKFPPKPVVDAVGKEAKADKRQAEVDAETKRHNREMEKAGDRADKRAVETERHNRVMERLGVQREERESKAAQVKEAKVTAKQLLKDEKGNLRRLMTDGSIQVVDEITGEWVKARPEQLKNLTGVGYPPSVADEMYAKVMKKNLGEEENPEPVSAEPPPAAGTVPSFKSEMEARKLAAEAIASGKVSPEVVKKRFKKWTGVDY